MEIAGLLFIGLAVVLSIAWAASNLNDRFSSSLMFLFGVVSILLFAIVAARVLKDGSPVLDIKAGQYKVAFVYEAGDNVSIVIESKTDKEVKKHLRLYQFKKEAFDGQIRTEATTLTVIEGGDFKKLKLE